MSDVQLGEKTLVQELQSQLKRRRRELLAKLPTDCVVVIPANSEVVRSRDTHFTFRQDSDFWYLTGINEPDAVLVLAPNHKYQELLFVLPKDPLQEVWHGRRLGCEQAQAISGVDRAYELNELEPQLLQLLNGQQSLYFAFDQHPECETMLRRLCKQLADTPKRAKTAPQCWCDPRPLLHQMRLIKSPYEQAQMRRAAEISAQGMVRAMQVTQPGRYEYQIAAELEHTFKWAGAAGPAYGIICGGGENACILHYTENSSQLRAGDLLLIDAGAEYAGYAGDISRTFPVNGVFSEPQREVYELVLRAQEAVLQSIQPGSSLPELTNICLRELTIGLLELGILSGELGANLANQACRKYLIHGLGHWLGLDVHDVGLYDDHGQPTKFVPGMVFTVEPGLYFAPDDTDVPERYRGIGVRIEDDILVTAAGYENLTASVPKQIDEIEALMRAAASERETLEREASAGNLRQTMTEAG